jgi:hypothetical protein
MFPVIRLILPSLDKERSAYGIKEVQHPFAAADHKACRWAVKVPAAKSTFT